MPTTVRPGDAFPLMVGEQVYYFTVLSVDHVDHVFGTAFVTAHNPVLGDVHAAVDPATIDREGDR